MRLSRYVLVGIVLIAALFFGGLGATQAQEASGGLRSTQGTQGMMEPHSQATCGSAGMMGSPGSGGMMGGGQPCPGSSGTPMMGGTQVAIQGYMYHPMMLQVPSGTTVTWTNEDSVAHSVTFRNRMADSGLLQEGQTFRYTFQAAGTYAYFCSVHPYVHGSVTVTP